MLDAVCLLPAGAARDASCSASAGPEVRQPPGGGVRLMLSATKAAAAVAASAASVSHSQIHQIEDISCEQQ